MRKDDSEQKDTALREDSPCNVRLKTYYYFDILFSATFFRQIKACNSYGGN